MRTTSHALSLALILFVPIVSAEDPPPVAEAPPAEAVKAEASPAKPDPASGDKIAEAVAAAEKSANPTQDYLDKGLQPGTKKPLICRQETQSGTRFSKKVCRTEDDLKEHEHGAKDTLRKASAISSGQQGT